MYQVRRRKNVNALIFFLPVTPAAVKAMLGGRRRTGAGRSARGTHLSRKIICCGRARLPGSRLELRFARLVPRKTTRIVLCDDNDGLTVARG